MKKFLLPIFAAVLGFSASAADDKTYDVTVYTTFDADTAYIDVTEPFATTLTEVTDDSGATVYTLANIYGSGAEIKFSLGETNEDGYREFTLLNAYKVSEGYESMPFLGNAEGNGYLSVKTGSTDTEIIPDSVFNIYLYIPYCYAYSNDDESITCIINYSGDDADGEYTEYYDMEFSWNPNETENPVEPDDPTAIENIGTDAAEAEYFNLQGVKVVKPERGLYIRRVGSQVSKVRL